MDTGNAVIDEVKDAAHEAIKGVGEAAGIPVIHKPTHRAAMHNLTPEEMQAMVDEFGQERVMNYLRRLQ